MLRKARYILQGALLVCIYVFFRLLPLDVASAFGGFLGRLFGPLLRAHRVASRNLRHTMPRLPDEEYSRILRGMWDNLGRVGGEYPHLARPLMARRITLEGREHLEKIMASGKGSLFISGHFANWEIGPLTAALNGLSMALIYRAPNNPVADWLIRHIRNSGNMRIYPKGRDGARQMMRSFQAGEAVGFLADQKMNEGIAVPFFGHDAMTAPGMVQLALKWKVPVLFARVVRTDGAHFHVTLWPPQILEDNAQPKEVLTRMHHLFESWIRENPSQWFWVHNRWNFK